MSNEWKVDSRKLAAAAAKAQNDDLTEDQQEQAITGAAMRQHKKQLQGNKDRLIRFIINLAAKNHGLADLRKTYPEGENEEERKEQEMLFQSFCSNCLVLMKDKMHWLNNYFNVPI